MFSNLKAEMARIALTMADLSIDKELNLISQTKPLK